MAEYSPAQICLNGHVISSNSNNKSIFCEKCGEITISICKKCNAQIRGRVINYGNLNLHPYIKPDFCPECGSPYPWTERALQAIEEIINEDDDLYDDEKEKITLSLPDLITETPKSNLAVVKMKKTAMRASKFTGEAIQQFIISFGCEFVKKQMGL